MKLQIQVIVDLDLDLPIQNSKLVFESQPLNFSLRYLFPGLRADLYFGDWFYLVDPITRMIIPLGLSYLIFTVIRTTTIRRDVARWYRMRIRGQEDPFLKIGETNASSKKGVSDVGHNLEAFGVL